MEKLLNSLVAVVQLFKDPMIAVTAIALVALGVAGMAIYGMATVAVKQREK